MDKMISRLKADFPNHSFDVRKGMFGMQLLVDGTIATNTWDMGTELVNNVAFAESVKNLNAEDSLYMFLKLKIELYLNQKNS